ncbi:MAG: hypothetical protein EON93_07760, partial [Burkholderiales bacterium]
FTLAAAAPPVFGAATSGANTITGNAAANTINGLGGNDILGGAGGNDVISGGEGADTLNGDDGNDTLSGGTGSDATSFADNFDGQASYSDNNGAAVFTGAWTESGDITTGNIATGGQIRINNNVLVFGDNDNDAGLGSAQIDRALNLAGATSATVSYSFTQAGFDAGEIVTVLFSPNGVAPFQTVQTISNASGANGTVNAVALTGPFTANAVIRFVVSGTNGNNAADLVTINNLAINATIPGLNNGVDTVNGGAGDDLVVWNANAAGATDGRDIVDGGTEDAGGDTFVINGNASAEEYRIYTRTAWGAVAGNSLASLAAGTEIVITRNGAGFASVIAELREIEEIRLNGVDPAGAGGPAGNDTFQIIGDFSGTSLRLNTVTISGSSADDVIDITGLTSAHRVVFTSNGGEDTIKGEKRAQDVVNVTEGGTLVDDRVVTTTPGEGNTGEDDEDEAGSAVISGGSGDDKLSGGQGADTINGGSGDDTLVGRSGADTLNGGSGDDILKGGSDNDRLNGGSGDDMLSGGSGDDVLDGGAGDDVLSGGSGADIFRFGAGDSITDFDTGDRIDLAAEGVTAATFASAVSLTQKGDDVWLKIGASKMLLSDVDVDDLDLSDFILSDTAAQTGSNGLKSQAIIREATEQMHGADIDLGLDAAGHGCRDLLDV